MKINYRPLIRGTNWALAGILSALGFPSCDREYRVEYGTPYATYHFRGKIVNEAGEPVPDIKIEAGASNHEPKGNPGLSRATGEYAVSLQSFPADNIRLYVSDIDGDANGSFQNDTVGVNILPGDYKKEKGSGTWDDGTVDREINIVLKEKQ
ncbi:MAG: radical SAM-associated putative lipoprotein [Tannerella sp.]|jgi:putative lipoprotein (rSAM/lipoprotein system)|nr:radical SAM-associated putative lipoprotein [Tannerella sp.]